MEPRKLRKLLEILQEHGVTRYKCEGIELEMVPGMQDLALANRMYGSALAEVNEKIVANDEFSMDNYVNVETEEPKGENSGTTGDLTNEEMLYWSANS